jgi:hypothetical protein
MNRYSRISTVTEALKESRQNSLQTDRARRIEVEVQLISDKLDYLLRFDAISRFIEARRKYGNSAFSRRTNTL